MDLLAKKWFPKRQSKQVFKSTNIISVSADLTCYNKLSKCCLKASRNKTELFKSRMRKTPMFIKESKHQNYLLLQNFELVLKSNKKINK